MDEEKKPSIEDQKKDDSKNPREALEEMIEEFGLDRGVDFFRRGISIDEAREEDYQSLKAQRLQSEEKKTQCASEPDEEPKCKQDDANAALKAEVVKLAQEISTLKSTLRRGDPSSVSPSFSQEDVAARRLSFKNPLEAAAYKFKNNSTAANR